MKILPYIGFCFLMLCALCTGIMVPYQRLDLIHRHKKKA